MTNSRRFRVIVVGILAATAVIVTASISLAGGTTTRSATAFRSDRVQHHLTLELLVNPTTIDAVRQPPPGSPPPPSGPFYFSGSIYPPGSLDAKGTPKPGATAIGTFRTWGWIFDPKTVSAVLNQSLELTDRGTIQLQGSAIGATPRAIVGGTDQFRGVQGDVTVTSIKAPFAASFTLNLIGGCGGCQD
jgi:hypothetical protein